MYKPFCFLLLVFTFLGCSNRQNENDELYRKINENLLNSIEVVEFANSVSYRKLDEDTADFQTRDVAIKYQARALAVKEKSDIVCRYIDSINKKIKNQENPSISKKESDQLLKNLNKFIHDILNFNDDVHKIFKEDTIVDFLRTKRLNGVDFYQSFFANSKGEKCKMAINLFYNNARLAENRIVSYCATNYCKIKIVYK